MRAITYVSYGPASVLSLAEVPQPSLRPNEVLLHVGGVEITKSDCEIRAMSFPVQWYTLPLRLMFGWKRPRKQVLGAYLAGRVVQVGGEVTRFKVGDEVYGSSGMRFGGYAEYVNIPEQAALAAKPSNLSFVEAAAIPLGGLNALHFMRRATLSPGERVLIIGAGGSIGSFALQIAKLQGAHVTAVDAAHKLKWLTALGADEVLDYAESDVLDCSETYDVIFSTVAADHFGRCLRALKTGGRYLTANPRFADFGRSVWTNWTSDKRAVVAFAAESKAELDTLREMAERGEIRVTLDRVLPLEAAAAGHARVESEQRTGNVVLDLGLGGP